MSQELAKNCWINGLIAAYNNIPAPAPFVEYAAIWCVGAALERRVWATTAMSRVYANLFTLFVAPPGVGKSMILTPVKEIMRRTRVLKVAPNDMTAPSLLDKMAEAEQTKPVAGQLLTYASLAVCASEFGVFVKAHDTAFLNQLNELYDCGNVFQESRRSRKGDDLEIHNPQISVLAGTQPQFLGSMLPEEAWGMGFMSRMIMVYHGTPTKPDLFGQSHEVKISPLVDTLLNICDLEGEIVFSKEAQQALTAWYAQDLRPVPSHSKLKHYNTRRILHTLKFCMISAAARLSMTVELFDFQRAQDWILRAESTMPDVFKDMGGKSDISLLQDLESAVRQSYYKNNRPISESHLRAFIQARTPAYNIKNVLDAAVQSNIICHATKDGKKDPTGQSPYYMPGTQDSWSIE
jgi:hypothetical protein